MEYCILLHKKDHNGKWSQELLSRHKEREEAYTAGQEAFDAMTNTKNSFIECISGNVADDGTIIGQFQFYKMWR